MNRSLHSKKKKVRKYQYSRKHTFIDYYKVSIPWLKSLIWPFVIIFMVFLIKTPINKTLYNISEMITRATSLQYKSVSLEIQEAIESRASKEMQIALTGISGDALYIMLKQGYPPDSIYAYVGHILAGCPKTKDFLFEGIPGLYDLEKRNLITISEYNYKDCIGSFEWKWTELGLESHKFIMDILTSEIFKVLQE